MSLRRSIKSVIPPKRLADLRGLRNWFKALIYLGWAVQCPVCKRRFRRFASVHRKHLPVRLNAKCPGCGAVERHRLLSLYIESRSDLFGENLSVLHFAPEPFLASRLRRLSNLRYVSADIAAPDADITMDITKIPLTDSGVDLVLCLHVLEHVPDDRQALLEMHRILRPGGRAILMVPISGETTREDPDAPAETRMRLFGQEDHVRLYGEDFADRIREAGFEVDVVHFAQQLDETSRRTYGIKDRVIFSALKADAGVAAASTS